MAFVKPALQQVVVSHESIELRISGGRLRALLTGAGPPAEGEASGRTVSLICPIQVRSIGAEIRIISDGVKPASKPHSTAFLKAIYRAREWYDQIVRGEAASFEDLAKQHGVTSRYIRRVFRSASLSPQTVNAVLADRPVKVGFEGLRRPIPLDWSKQTQ
jgi:hypothetical protein